MGFDAESKRMMLVSTHPGVSVKDVVDNTGFKLIVPERVPVTGEPSSEELRLLREELDPNKIVIG
jgi:glutaconate CoA-transferase subunit B